MDVDPEHKPRRERAALSTGLAARLANAQLTRVTTTMYIWPRPMGLGACGCSYVEPLDPAACFIEVAWFGLLPVSGRRRGVPIYRCLSGLQYSYRTQ